MPLKVRCRAQYLTRPVDQMRPADYDATHLVKAVKGLSLNANAFSRVMIAGRWQKITEANKDLAMDWFAEWAAQHINALGVHRKIIVPVPSSKTTPSSPASFRTALLAQRISALCRNTLPFPSLRFAAERPNSREEGGSRSAMTLYNEMVLTTRLPAGQLILLDDVLTGGGHLKASAWKIEGAGGAVSEAICCGRSSEHQIDNPFEIPIEELEIDR